ncbi:MAG: hypothetical protein U9R31_02160 [Candidatus Omnitrophota bacterium]|nr:hypothetical protein [Candidatus Omnitrophota bacterium]
MKIKDWLLNDMGLKILSLVMAILLWLYIAGEQESINLKSIIDSTVNFFHQEIETKNP